ncbi:MAG: preprotein translocase subunit YajC [Candidatus Aminicenantia bacterium]
MMLINSILYQAQTTPRGGGNFMTALIPFILVFLIFYLLIIWPARKRQKKHKEMVEQLKPGDKVITSGGIYGTVMGVQRDKIELKIASNVKVEVAKSAIAGIIGAEAKK